MRQYGYVILLLFLLSTLQLTFAQSTRESSIIWQPTVGITWQWQLSGTLDTSYDVDMYDIDLFDTSTDTIEGLKSRGVIVICYFSAGSYENWRPDAAQFPAHILGKKLDGWAGERWLNIAEIAALSNVMIGRLDLAVEKGCDGVEPDNVDGYTNKTGFKLTYDNQIRYNVWLSEQAHMRGLSIGLKNNLDQVNDLLPFYDWALNEQCFQYDECDLLLPFITAGKAVFGVEYELNPTAYCETANAYGFSWLSKTYDLANEAPNACSGTTPTITITPVVTEVPTDVPATPEPTEDPLIDVTITPEPTEDSPIDITATSEPTEDSDEYNKKGYDDEGYDADGYNKKGYDRDGYNRDGYDKKGYDREGYNKKGYDSDGYDREWYNKKGYNLAGFDADGYDKKGYDSAGYDADGYDKKGYDRDGYDDKGYDAEGYNREGYDKKGCTRDSC